MNDYHRQRFQFSSDKDGHGYVVASEPVAG